MKLINRLEKSKPFWFLLFIFTLFFLLRAPSLIEPHWYGDEGIYQVLGLAINDGRMLYSEIWDNKPPLLYVTYALFNSDQFMVRLASLFSGLLAMITLFFLSQKIFANLRASIITTTLFTILFATPYLEGNIANAENFMLLPIILAGLFVYRLSTQKLAKEFSFFNSHFSFFLPGCLLGIAFLFKIVAVFDLAAFFIFLLFVNLPKKFSWKEFMQIFNHESRIINHESWFFPLIHNSLFLILGFLTPLIFTLFYFLLNNALPDFIRATFFGNIGYVGWGNKFIIPQGFLILKILLLFIVLFMLFFQRNRLSKSSLFIFLWVAFGLFNAFFSQRPYTHYVLVTLPSICLFVGLMAANKNKKIKVLLGGILFLILVIITASFNFYPLRKTILYYQNAISFVTGTKDITSYQSFFDRKTPRDYEIASFIRNNTKSEDNVFIWGDSAQIYALSNKLPLDKYTVAYHITQSNNAISAMQTTINTINPKYIIVLAEAPNFPFRLTGYSDPLLINTTLIYEKIR